MFIFLSLFILFNEGRNVVSSFFLDYMRGVGTWLFFLFCCFSDVFTVACNLFFIIFHHFSLSWFSRLLSHPLSLRPHSCLGLKRVQNWNWNEIKMKLVFLKNKIKTKAQTNYKDLPPPGSHHTSFFGAEALQN